MNEKFKYERTLGTKIMDGFFSGESGSYSAFSSDRGLELAQGAKQIKLLEEIKRYQNIAANGNGSDRETPTLLREQNQILNNIRDDIWGSAEFLADVQYEVADYIVDTQKEIARKQEILARQTMDLIQSVGKNIEETIRDVNTSAMSNAMVKFLSGKEMTTAEIARIDPIFKGGIGSIRLFLNNLMEPDALYYISLMNRSTSLMDSGENSIPYTDDDRRLLDDNSYSQNITRLAFLNLVDRLPSTRHFFLLLSTERYGLSETDRKYIFFKLRGLIKKLKYGKENFEAKFVLWMYGGMNADEWRKFRPELLEMARKVRDEVHRRSMYKIGHLHSKDKYGGCYYLENKMEHVDYDSFREVYFNLAADTDWVYYQGEKVSGNGDKLKSIKNIPDSLDKTGKKPITLFSNEIFIWINDQKLDGVDAANFYVYPDEASNMLGYSRGACLCRDDSMLMSIAHTSDREMETFYQRSVQDPKSFKMLSMTYAGDILPWPIGVFAQDNTSLYYKGTSSGYFDRIYGSVPGTFQQIDGGIAAKDANSVYLYDNYSAKKLIGADPTNFRLYRTKPDGSTVSRSEIKYGTDMKTVFRIDKNPGPISIMDPLTFLDIREGYSKDNRFVNYKDQWIKGADSATFLLKNNPTSMFPQSAQKVIRKYDRSSYLLDDDIRRAMSKYDSADKNFLYQEGKKILDLNNFYVKNKLGRFIARKFRKSNPGYINEQ